MTKRRRRARHADFRRPGGYEAWLGAIGFPRAAARRLAMVRLRRRLRHKFAMP